MTENSGTPLFSQQRWAQLRQSLQELQDLAATDREQALLDIEKNDAEFAASLRELLTDADSLFTRPSEPGIEGLMPTGEVIPERIGPFRLLERIGVGGMGVIYLAEREHTDFVQRVAIKLLDGGTQRLAMLASRERRILAALAHPNITAFVDAGIEQGRAWMAMEYVEGDTLVDYCAGHELDVRERVQLFDQVCAAVAHAHTQLVVHRDLKPSNILVSRNGVAKLLDFGIALALDSSDDSTPATRVFTPEYAAPEQLRGERATTATDVYSLGLILYELVSQRRLPILDRATRDGEWTTTELARHAMASDAAITQPGAARRAIDPQLLSRLMRGDLGRIIAHALNPVPAQRYASVASLREDLGRWLAFRPLTIGRPSVLYVARRFARRHRLGVAMGGTAMITVLGLGSAAIWQAHAKTLEAERARTALRQSEVTRDFVSSMFLSADPYQGKGMQVTAGELLAAARKRIDTELANEPEVATALLSKIASVYVTQGDDEATRDVLRKAMDFNARSAQPSAELDASASARLAYINYQAGHDPLDRRRIDDAVLQLRTLGSPAKASLGLALLMQGNLLFGEGRHDEAIAISGEAVQILEPLGKAHAWEYLWALSGYADMLASLDRSEEALAMADRGLGHPHLNLPEGAALRQDLLGSRARALAGLRRYAEAEPALAQVIDAVAGQFDFQHSKVRYWRYRRIQVLEWMGRLDDAHTEVDALLGAKASSDEHPMAHVAHLVEALIIDAQRRVADPAAELGAAREAACGEHGAAKFCAKVKLIDAEIALRLDRDAAARALLDECSKDEAIVGNPDLGRRMSLLRAVIARHEGRTDEGRKILDEIRAGSDVPEEFVAEIDVESGFLALASGDKKMAVEALTRGRTYIAQPLVKLTPRVLEIDAAIALAQRTL
jgi:serine/threonine protein kinase